MPFFAVVVLWSMIADKNKKDLCWVHACFAVLRFRFVPWFPCIFFITFRCRFHQGTNFSTFDSQSMIITDSSSNECILEWLKSFFGWNSFMGFEYAFGVGNLCTLFSLEWMLFAVHTTISGRIYFSLLFVRWWRHLQHIWMNIECIHVSNSSFDPSTNFRKICIVGFGFLYSFSSSLKRWKICVCMSLNVRKSFETWNWHWRNGFLLFQLCFFSFFNVYLFMLCIFLEVH